MCPDSWDELEQGQLCSLLCPFVPMHLLSVAAHAQGRAEDDTTEHSKEVEIFSH